jgi:putative two-component system response regulator
MKQSIEIQNMRLISIDDTRNNLLMIEALSERLGIQVWSYLDPLEALEVLRFESFDIVVVDYMMPEMDGLAFIKKFREMDENTPIVMITAAEENSEIQLKALDAGATDFLSKPINGAIFQARISNLLKLKKSMNLVSNKAKLLKNEVKDATEEIRVREREILQIIGKLSEYKDPETNEHVLRVAHYSKIIANAFGLSEKVQDYIFNAAPLHDVGKIGIPDSILLKEGGLTPEEWDLMMTHAELGYRLLKESKSPYLQVGSVIAYSHHERYDGTGYPNKLEGSMIPLYGRILAIADVFDALCSKRPYKDRWTFDDAFNYIVSQSGSQFDPKCVACFVKSRTEIEVIFNSYKEDEHE